MDNTVVTTGVSVDRILELQQEINSLNDVLSSKDRELGAVEAHNDTLRAQLEEAKSKQPEVRVVKGSYKKNPWSDKFELDLNTETLEYRNLSSIQDDIRKELEAKYKKDQDLSEKIIKDLNKTLETNKDDYDRKLKSKDSDYAAYNQSLDLEYRDRKLKLDKKLSDKDLEIQKIREELEKVKNDKTDEQVAKQHEEEITKLKLRIKELEKTVKEFMNMNFLKRFWNSLTNKAVRVAAEKEVIEKQQEINKIKSNTSTISWINDYYNAIYRRF